MELHNYFEAYRYKRAMGDEGSRPASVACVAETLRYSVGSSSAVAGPFSSVAFFFGAVKFHIDYYTCMSVCFIALYYLTSGCIACRGALQCVDIP